MKKTQHSKTAIALLAMAYSTTLGASARADNTSGVPIPTEPTFPTGDAAARGYAIAKHAEAYDSGWVGLDYPSSTTLYHNVGGDIDDYFIELTFRGFPSPVGIGINNDGIGTDGYFHKVTTNWLVVTRTGGINNTNIRVRIWVIN